MPERPWLHIRIDFYELEGIHHLLVVDYVSRWIEIEKLASLSSIEIIQIMEIIFCRFGISDSIRSDGEPQFSSTKFRVFCEENEINHSKSSPHTHQGNGAAERAVQVAEIILKQFNPLKALLAYRATAIEVTGCSLSQLLMRRNIIAS